MASRLFHAVVGLGISLGAVAAACVGTDEDSAATTDASSSDTSSSMDHDMSDHATHQNEDADSDLDATSLPKDVSADAFCDASWPTTKGNPAGPTCGSTADCKDAGPAPHCFYSLGGTVCESKNTGLAAYCTNQQWHCSNGSVPVDQCKCWGLPDGGKTCP